MDEEHLRHGRCRREHSIGNLALLQWFVQGPAPLAVMVQICKPYCRGVYNYAPNLYCCVKLLTVQVGSFSNDCFAVWDVWGLDYVSTPVNADSAGDPHALEAKLTSCR